VWLYPVTGNNASVSLLGGTRSAAIQKWVLKKTNHYGFWLLSVKFMLGRKKHTATKCGDTQRRNGMLKRNAKVIAQDNEGHRLEINISFKSRNGLMRDEVDTVVRGAARRAARMIRELSHTDFAEENTAIRM